MDKLYLFFPFRSFDKLFLWAEPVAAVRASLEKKWLFERPEAVSIYAGPSCSVQSSEAHEAGGNSFIKRSTGADRACQSCIKRARRL